MERSKGSIIESYEEHEREVGNWMLQIVVYKLGEKFVCIINNLDPGATICRVSAATRDEALVKALHQANIMLSRQASIEFKPKPEPTELKSIEYGEGEIRFPYSIDEFLNLPLQERMDLILSGGLSYFDGSGRQIASGLAMKLLRQACAPDALAA